MNVILPDGSELALPEGATGRTVAEKIGRLAKAALGVTLSTALPGDLVLPLSQGGPSRYRYGATKEGLDLLRHSASHVMAEAVTRVYPGTKWPSARRSKMVFTTTSISLSPFPRGITGSRRR